MRYLLLLLFVPPVVLGATCAGFTTSKLHAMRQIRGELPGAKTERQIITDLWESPAVGTSSPGHWVAWNGWDVHKSGSQRAFLAKEAWRRYHRGDAIEIVTVPGDDSPYLRDGIYASDGNLAFDRTLQMVEFGILGVSLAGAAVLALVLRRRPTRPPAPG
jgi:hypothetical protein